MKPPETHQAPSPRAAKTVLEGKKKELDEATKRAQIEQAEAEDAARAPEPPKPSPTPDPEKVKEVKEGWLSGGLTFFD